MSGWIVLIALCAVALLVVCAAVTYDRRRCRASTGHFSVQVLVRKNICCA
jgi:anti-sigma-K factor RskA